MKRVLILVLLIIASAQAPPDPFVGLPERYPWGSMYLTHRNVAELTNYLSKKKASLSASDKSTIIVLDQFLASHDEVAFLFVDLKLLRAGFKNTMDTEGTVQQLPWEPSKVRAVACWLDRFLTAQATIARLHNQLEHNELTLTAAWTQVRAAHTLLASDTALTGLDTAYERFADRTLRHSGAIQFATGGSDTRLGLAMYLSPTYIKALPAADGWGTNWSYAITPTPCALCPESTTTQFKDGWQTQGYTLMNVGKDMPFSYGIATTRFDDDIVYANGSFVVWPKTPAPNDQTSPPPKQ